MLPTQFSFRLQAGLSIAIACLSGATTSLARVQEQPLAGEQSTNGTTPPAASSAAAKPLADRVAVSFTSPTGESTRAVVTVKWDAGDPSNDTPRKPRLRLSMGRLEIFASAGRLIATSRSDATTYFEAKLPDVITPESLRAALPPMPLPHIQWCFDPLHQLENAHPFGTQTALVAKGDDGLEQLTASDGTLKVWKSGNPSRPRRIELRYANGSQVHLTLSPIEVKPDDSWEIPVEGRRKVGSLSELRVDNTAPMVGRPFKDLGFTAPDFSEVSFDDLFAPNPGVSGAQATVLLVVASTREGLPTDSAARELVEARSAVDAAIETLHARDAKADYRSRVKVTVLRGLPLAELDIKAALDNAIKLAEPLEASRIVPRVRNTTSADWILKDQLGEVALAAVVINDARVVTFAAAPEVRPEGAVAFRAEVLQALEKALGIASLAEENALPTPSAPAPNDTAPPKTPK